MVWFFSRYGSRQVMPVSVKLLSGMLCTYSMLSEKPNLNSKLRLFDTFVHVDIMLFAMDRLQIILSVTVQLHAKLLEF